MEIWPHKLQVLGVVNRPFKDYLKQLYSEWPLAGDSVLTPIRKIKKPNAELLGKWVKIRAANLSRSDSQRI
jgi:hypothetical protein